MKSKDEQALRELMLAGYRYAFSLSHHKSQAEDLLHDAWLAVMQANGPMDKYYLFRSIRSRFINQFKRDNLVSISPLDIDENHLRSEFSQEDDLISQEIIENLLSQLKPVERESLFLWALEGYTAQEIGDLMNLSRGSVLSMLHRSKQKLREHLAKQRETS